MNTSIKDLIDVCQASELSPSKQTFLTGLFARANDSEISCAVDLFKSDKGWIKIVYDNIVTKKEAYRKLDANALRKIIEDEKERLAFIK